MFFNLFLCCDKHKHYKGEQYRLFYESALLCNVYISLFYQNFSVLSMSSNLFLFLIWISLVE